MKAEYGKYYLLDSEKFYWCVTLQRKTRFLPSLVVKCGSGFGETAHFGYLVNTNMSAGPDYETTNEIEFCDEDLIEEYNLKDMQLNYSTITDYLAKIDNNPKNMYINI